MNEKFYYKILVPLKLSDIKCTTSLQGIKKIQFKISGRNFDKTDYYVAVVLYFHTEIYYDDRRRMAVNVLTNFYQRAYETFTNF